MQRLEHGEQKAVIDWRNWNAARHPALRWLHAIPNGGHRHPTVANALKQEGVTSGVCDLFLPFPARGYHGLYIEMKRPGAMNEVKPNQFEFISFVNSVGYLAYVFDNADDAISAIKDYLGI